MPPAIPIATYRLQLTADFNFEKAAARTFGLPKNASKLAAVIIDTPHHSDQKVISRNPITPLALGTMSWRSIMIGANTT